MTTILEGENKIAPREALGSQEMWSRCPKNFACGAIYNGKITFSPLQQTQTTKKIACGAILYKTTRVYLYWSATSVNINFKLFTHLHKRLTWILEHRRRENFEKLTAYTKDLHIYF